MAPEGHERKEPVVTLRSDHERTVPSYQREKELLGLRGILAIQTIIYIFLEIFIPAAVVQSADDTAPKWQLFLRTWISVFLWNPSVVRAGFLILSARTICLPFLHRPDRLVLASALFRRPIRYFVPVGVALAVAVLVNNVSNTAFILHFKDLTNNVSLPAPRLLPSALTYFNALYMFFWTVRDYSAQAANKAFYNDSLWSLSVIYTQSYTVYLSAVLIPYTRARWRLKIWTLLILTAWWVQSWAWYSFTGLLLADATVHMRLREYLTRGLPLRLGKEGKWVLRFPGWMLGLFLTLTGGTLQFFWKEWRPSLGDGQSAVAQPQAREDDFLIVIGILLLLESLQWLRTIVGNRAFVAVGERSLSLYVTSSLVFNNLAVALFLHLVEKKGLSSVGAICVAVTVSLAVTWPLAEAFYRLVEVPTGWASIRLFAWVTE